MKYIFLYFMLVFLGISIIATIDLLSGMSLSMAFHSIHSAFTITTLQEIIVMIAFLSIPFIQALPSLKEAK
ncbi:hypothetical protein J2T13_004387 [Paenibacillus sp. DS2015]|uniref:hypothetical protein n=1 Tax=Paenibacillus sp. DS2015 TaxID=3373917 RepID=UPI003D21FA00